MLKLKDISSSINKVYNEPDYYVTVKILLEKISHFDGVCYWDAYGKENSFVQIGLSNQTGAIYKIVSFLHPSIKYQITSDTAIIDPAIPKKIGLPLFETYIEKYQEGYYHLPDEKIDFKFYASAKSSILFFYPNTVVLQVVNDPIIFGFDKDNNLCYICIQNMTLNEEGFLE